MSLYSSGKHEKLIADPEPWAYAHNSKPGPGPFGTPDRAATRWDKAMLYFPRPEFDRPLSNPANPILVELRRKLAAEPISLADAAQWFCDWIRFGRAEDIPSTPAHGSHAWRVLTRLTVLS